MQREKTRQQKVAFWKKELETKIIKIKPNSASTWGQEKNTKNSDIYRKSRDNKMSEFLVHHCIMNFFSERVPLHFPSTVKLLYYSGVGTIRREGDYSPSIGTFRHRILLFMLELFAKENRSSKNWVINFIHTRKTRFVQFLVNRTVLGLTVEKKSGQTLRIISSGNRKRVYGTKRDLIYLELPILGLLSPFRAWNNRFLDFGLFSLVYRLRV